MISRYITEKKQQNITIDWEQRKKPVDNELGYIHKSWYVYTLNILGSSQIAVFTIFQLWLIITHDSRWWKPAFVSLPTCSNFKTNMKQQIWEPHSPPDNSLFTFIFIWI